MVPRTLLERFLAQCVLHVGRILHEFATSWKHLGRFETRFATTVLILWQLCQASQAPRHHRQTTCHHLLPLTSAHHHHPHISFHSSPSLPHPAPNLSSCSPSSSSSLCSLRQFPQLSNLHNPHSFYNLSFTISVSLHRSSQSFTATLMPAVCQ